MPARRVSGVLQKGLRIVLLAGALGASLAALWLLLSGYWQDPVLLCLGLVSVLAVVGLARRLHLLDREGVPIHLLPRLFAYLPWLLWQIVLSNLRVARLILSPGLPISPTLAVVRTSQRSELGQVIYANSITLTPGTISVDVDGDGILVHALERDGVDGLEDGEMDRRVTALEGASHATSPGGASR